MSKQTMGEALAEICSMIPPESRGDATERVIKGAFLAGVSWATATQTEWNAARHQEVLEWLEVIHVDSNTTKN